jgi:hypothetical protein
LLHCQFAARSGIPFVGVVGAIKAEQRGQPKALRISLAVPNGAKNRTDVTTPATTTISKSHALHKTIQYFVYRDTISLTLYLLFR